MVRAVVMPKPMDPLEVREYADPELRPGEVLLETLCSEICGTDIHLHHGKLAGVPYPLIPGHVSVGKVLETSGEILDVEGRPVMRDQVVTFLDVHETCGHCWHCLVAQEATKCPNRKVYGITYGADDGLYGGWSEQIVLQAGMKILPLPDGMEPHDYMGVGCGMSTGFHAIERAGVKMDDIVVVQGAGPVGLSAAAFARLSGAGMVIVIGAPRERLAFALRFEADATLDINELSPEERLQAVHDVSKGRGADVVIEASGNPVAVREGLDLARVGGTYVIVGQYTDAGEVPVNPHTQINAKHLDIKGCWGTAFTHVYRGIRMIARTRDRFPWREMVTHSFGMDEANEGLALVAGFNTMKALITPGSWRP